MHRLLVFDLDGTLVDSSPDIVRATNATLLEIGMPSLSESLIVSFVGEGSRELLKKCLTRLQRFDEDTLNRAVDFFFDYYYEHISDYSFPYPGVVDSLARMESAKIVLTNKPTKMAVKLLKNFAMDGYFLEIIGGDRTEELKPNPVNLLQAMNRHGFSRENTWMIGDSVIDIRTARNAGVRAISALYGFLPADELKRNEPDDMIERFSDLLCLSL